MGDMYATILRQTYFTLFEKEAHEAIQKGITEKDLSKMYLNNLKQQFGDAVEVPEMFQYEWSYVSHIFSTPFYCYAYSFGQLLALSLYGKYKKNKSFLKNIEEILKAGGSKNPEKLLKKQGVNIRDESFWQEGFDIMNKWI
jgi:oligoendopeptidase F